jgi:hypothetical protein
VISDSSFIAHFGLVSIEEIIKLETVSIIPNPTKDDFIISFDVIKPSNIEIKLLDLSGREVLEIYNDFVTEEKFVKTVSTSFLSSGVYFLHILINGNTHVEKVVLER